MWTIVTTISDVPAVESMDKRSAERVIFIEQCR